MFFLTSSLVFVTAVFLVLYIFSFNYSYSYVLCLYRRVLVNAGFQLSDDDEFVLFVVARNKYDDDDDDVGGGFGDDDTDAEFISVNCDNRASLEHHSAVVEEDWC